MAKARRKDAETRRQELIAAAMNVFARKGVADATVSDIVKTAGVAQGTFYLYFATKQAVMDALVERMVDEMVDAFERAVADRGAGAVAKLLALRDRIRDLADDGTGQALAAVYRRPENRAVHARMEERAMERLAPLVERIVVQGVAEGAFTVDDPRVAAWFVLGGIRAADGGVQHPEEVGAAIAQAMACALRALGYAEPIPTR